jgi:hypothetical protein
MQNDADGHATETRFRCPTAMIRRGAVQLAPFHVTASPLVSTAAQNAGSAQETDEAVLIPSDDGADHVWPFHAMNPPPVSTATQNDRNGQDTAARPMPSTDAGADQLAPFQTATCPATSTATQKLELAHDTAFALRGAGSADPVPSSIWTAVLQPAPSYTDASPACETAAQNDGPAHEMLSPPSPIPLGAGRLHPTPSRVANRPSRPSTAQNLTDGHDADTSTLLGSATPDEVHRSDAADAGPGAAEKRTTSSAAKRTAIRNKNTTPTKRLDAPEVAPQPRLRSRGAMILICHHRTPPSTRSKGTPLGLWHSAVVLARSKRALSWKLRPAASLRWGRPAHTPGGSGVAQTKAHRTPAILR